MDNLLEFVVPLIFAAIYFFGNMLSKGGEDDAPKPSRPQRRPEADPAAEERQRRIQEEIRRKIMERRHAAEGAPSERNVRRERTPPPQPEPAPVAEVTKQPVEVTSVEQSETKDFSWDVSDNAYETEMQRRMQEIEATKQRAKQLQQQAAQASKRADTPSRSQRSGRQGHSRLSGSVRQSLRDPAAARAAFVYGEVLGQPVSLKKSSSVPGLN